MLLPTLQIQQPHCLWIKRSPKERIQLPGKSLAQLDDRCFPGPAGLKCEAIQVTFASLERIDGFLGENKLPCRRLGSKKDKHTRSAT
jgi:hypothetical protein